MARLFVPSGFLPHEEMDLDAVLSVVSQSLSDLAALKCLVLVLPSKQVRCQEVVFISVLLRLARFRQGEQEEHRLPFPEESRLPLGRLERQLEQGWDLFPGVAASELEFVPPFRAADGLERKALLRATESHAEYGAR